MCRIEMELLTKKSPRELIEMAKIEGPPVDPFLIAERIGVKVREELDWEKLPYDGEIYLNENDCPEIWINPTDHINRRKFTLAHELGHLVNDVLPNIDKFKDPIRDDYTTLRRGASRDLREIVANRFAASLLMPKAFILEAGTQIVEEFQEGNEGSKIPAELFVKIMSKKFEVSEQAMKYRLQNLGYIS